MPNSNTTIVSINLEQSTRQTFAGTYSNTTIVSINRMTRRLNPQERVEFKYNYCFY